MALRCAVHGRSAVDARHRDRASAGTALDRRTNRARLGAARRLARHRTEGQGDENARLLVGREVLCSCSPSVVAYGYEATLIAHNQSPTTDHNSSDRHSHPTASRRDNELPNERCERGGLDRVCLFWHLGNPSAGNGLTDSAHRGFQ